MAQRGRWRYWKWALAGIGLGIGVAGGRLASWLLPAPVNAAESVVMGNREYISRSSTECQIFWTGAKTWDAWFLGPGTLLATAGPRNPLSFRDLAGNEPAWILEDTATPRNGQTSSGFVWLYAFSPDGSKVAGDVGGSPRSLCIWDIASRRPSAAVLLADRSPLQLAFSADGKRLAVGWYGFGKGDRDSIGMTMFDASTWAELSSLRIDDLPRNAGFHGVAISADSGTLAIKRKPDALELWDASTSRLRTTITWPTTPGYIGSSEWVFSPDGSAMAARLSDGAIGLWDCATGQQRLKATRQLTEGAVRSPVRSKWFPLGNTIVHPFAFSRDSLTLAIACPDGAVRLWDISSARLTTVLPLPVPAFDSSGPILFSADGRYLAVAGEGPPTTRIDRLPAALRAGFTSVREPDPSDQVARLTVWELTGRRQRIVAQAAGRFTALAFAGNISTLAAAREEPAYDEDGFRVREILRDVMLWSLDSSR